MVTGAYYPEISGAGLQCRALVCVLRDLAGFTVLTTTTDRSLPRTGDIDGVPVYRVVIEVSSIWSQFRAAARLSWWFVRLRRRFEVVHLHGFSRKTLLMILLARCFGKRIIQKLTSAGHDDPLSVRRRGRLSYRLYTWADRFLAPSQRLADLYRVSGLPAERLREVPNGVDTDRFHPPAQGERNTIRRTLGLPEEAFLILFVGFFSHEKHPDALFAAWRRAREAVALPSGVVFVGATRSRYYEVDPTVVDEIRQEARESGIEKDLHFVERTLEIDQYYRAADCFVLPSTREGLPNALLEAMASGLPCLATSLKGITDRLIVHGDNGFLFPPEDVEVLSGLLLLLMQDSDLCQRVGKRARQTALERFTIDSTARQILRIYRELQAPIG